MKLLVELLDALGSDDDRGILMASFSEAVVLAGNPHQYITLFDRVVYDYDDLFEGIVERTGSAGSATSSLSNHTSVNKGSYNSHSSSFRKRFGFGSNSNRENSKPETESKVATLLRTWSKNTKLPGDEVAKHMKITKVCKASSIKKQKLLLFPLSTSSKAAFQKRQLHITDILHQTVFLSEIEIDGHGSPIESFTIC